MFRLISAEKIVVNEKKAQGFLNMNTYDAQRKANPKHILKLANKMEDGTFLTGHFATATMNYNGRQTVLVNGQHQAQAILKAGETVDALYEHFECDTPEDFSDLFRQFDDNRIRSFGDCAKVEARALNINWNYRIISLVAAAAALVDGKQFNSKTDRIECLKNYLREGSFINSILSEKESENRHMLRQPVVFAMILTWKKNHEAAKDFWMKVRDGEGLKKDMPEYKLRNYLMQVTCFKGMGARLASVRQPASYHEMASKCITAWNAYRKGETTSLKYFVDKQIPKAI